jgi:hypothetical protein
MSRQVLELKERIKNPAGKGSAKYDWHRRLWFDKGLYVVERVCTVDEDLLDEIPEDARKRIEAKHVEVLLYKVGEGSSALQTQTPLRKDHPGFEVLLDSLETVISNRLSFDALCATLGLEYESEILDIMRRLFRSGKLDVEAFKAEAAVEVERDDD